MTRVTMIRCNEPGCNKMTDLGPSSAKWKRNAKITIRGAWSGEMIEVLADFCPKHKKGK